MHLIVHAEVSAETDRRAWLDARHVGLGASDAATAVGLNPWSSPYALWVEKSQPLPSDEEQNAAMRIGTYLEAGIREMFADEYALRVEKPHGIFRHPEHAWMLATLDGIAYEGGGDEPLGVVEIKNTRFDKWDTVPVHYEIQVQHQLAVTGLSHAWLVALHGGSRAEVYEIERDDAAIAALIEQESRFWQMVLDGTPPDPDGSEASSHALARHYNAPTDKVVEVDDNDSVVSLVASLRTWVATAKTADEQCEALRNQIKARLGNATVLEIGGKQVATWRSSSPRKVDLKALEADHPELVEKYRYTKPVRRFLLTDEREK